MTLEQFLAWDDRQELRFEFDGFEAVAMTGGTAAHAGTKSNLIHALVGRQANSPCRAFGSELKVQVAGRIRYPKAFVVCTPVPPGSTVVRDPVVIFQVVSEGSGATDFVVKNAEYRATPSVQCYVVLQQTKAAAPVLARCMRCWWRLGRAYRRARGTSLGVCGVSQRVIRMGT